MADPKDTSTTNTNNTTPPPRALGNPGQASVDTQVGEGDSFSLDLGTTGLKEGENRHVVAQGKEGMTAEVGMGDADTIRTQDANLTNSDTTPKQPETPALNEDGTPKTPETPVADTPLPEFDAAKPEVVEAYGKRYLTDTGAPDLNKVSVDWKPTLDPATGMPTGGDLPEATYKFLATKGYDKATIKGIEAGQLALVQQEYTQTFAALGGPENYKAAQAWAKDNWSDAQRQTFNADRQAGGVRRENALKLLKADFTAANPTKRRASPERTVTDNSGSSDQMGTTVEPYATKAEWQKEVRLARETNNQKLLNQARTRLKASAWYSGQE